MPAAAEVAPEMVGFCEVEVKPLGPVQAYVAPATVGVARFRAEPAQTGVLEEAVGAEGCGFTVTVVVPARLVQRPTVAVTLYVPAPAAVMEAMVGF